MSRLRCTREDRYFSERSRGFFSAFLGQLINCPGRPVLSLVSPFRELAQETVQRSLRILEEGSAHTSCALLFTLVALVPIPASAQARAPGSGVIEGRIVSDVQSEVDKSIKVRAGNLELQFKPDERMTIEGEIREAGTLVRVLYVDLQKSGVGADYRGVALRIETIPKITMLNPTSKNLSLAPPIVHVVTRPGLYLTVGRCQACEYDDWQERVAGAFAEYGFAAVVGLPDWRSVSTERLMLYEHKKPDWMTEVVVGPVSDPQSLAHLIGLVPEILESELEAHQENNEVRPRDRYSFELGRFSIRTFPATTPASEHSRIYLLTVRVAVWAMAGLAFLGFILVIGLRSGSARKESRMI